MSTKNTRNSCAVSTKNKGNSFASVLRIKTKGDSYWNKVTLDLNFTRINIILSRMIVFFTRIRVIAS